MKRKTFRLVAPEPSEAEIQRALMSRLQMAGWLVVRINGGAFKNARGQYVRAYIIAVLNACAGFPDVIALRGSSFRLFEVKRAGGKVSQAQQRFHDFARRYGVQVEVIEGKRGLDAVTAQVLAGRFGHSTSNNPTGEKSPTHKVR